jgi:hypothetical protein
MSYPLFTLHQLIDELTQPVQVTTSEAQQVCLSIIQQATTEAHAFPLSFMQQAAGAKNNKAIQVLVHTCQAGCISLLNRLSIYMSTCSNGDHDNHTTLVAGYKELETQLLNSLSYLQQHFISYFDKEQQVPLTYRLSEQKKLEQQLLLLTAQWQKSSIHPELQSIALAPIQQFINAQPTWSCSFQQLDYFRNLLSALSAAASVHTGEPANRNIIDLLIRINFNDATLLQYIMQYLYKHINNTGLPHDQANQWALYEKYFAQIYTGTQALLSGSPSAKDALVSMIQQEIKYLNQQQNSLAAIYGSQATAASAVPKSTVHTTLTVSQAAVLIRLLIDCKIIEHDNQTELFRMVASAFKTTRATHISADGLKSRFYSLEPAAINIVKEHLHQMLTQLRKY